MGLDAATRSPFLLTLALLAHAAGFRAAYFADGSVSDSGCLFIPGGAAVSWDDATCRQGRARAEAAFKTLGPGAPEMDELHEIGPGAAFCSFELPTPTR